MNPPKIVLTGGPGGGKTTLMDELRTMDPEANRFVLVPEAATILLRAGHKSGNKDFQKAVVAIQLSLEEACGMAARKGHILICDRGTIDSLAYWRLIGGSDDEFFSATGLNREEHYGRYDGILHLQTAALDAEPHYRQLSDGSRLESIEEARRIDRLCGEVWEKHPDYFLIGNSRRDWGEKSRIAREWLEKTIRYRVNG